MFNKRIPSPLVPYNLYWLLLSLIILLLDQLTKYLASHFLTLYQPLPLVPFFNLTLAYNTGAAFSLFAHMKHSVLFLTLFAIAMSLFILVWLLRLTKNNTNAWLSIALALILGGALGNLLDRVLYGYVIDFIDVYWRIWHWPAFNIADSAICIGVAMVCLDCIKKQQK